MKVYMSSLKIIYKTVITENIIENPNLLNFFFVRLTTKF
jgi:hypothetical protein